MTIIVRFSCMHIQCKVYKISDVLQQAKSSGGLWIQPGFQLLLLEVNRTYDPKSKFVAEPGKPPLFSNIYR